MAKLVKIMVTTQVLVELAEQAEKAVTAAILEHLEKVVTEEA